MRPKHETIAPTMMPAAAGVSSSEMARAVDPWMAGAVVLLLSIGTVMIYSADGSLNLLFGQLGAVGFGLLVMLAVMRLPIEAWSKLAYPMLIVAVILLVAVFVPSIGHEAKGAARWIKLGGFRFQSAEFAKLAVVVYLAHSLAKKRERASTFSIGFLPHVLVTSLVVGLILKQPDLGSSAVIYATLGLMLFVAGTRIAYLVLAVGAAVPVLFAYVLSHPHASVRIMTFLEPEADKLGSGYQIWESLVAFGSGGVSGMGLGGGRQELNFLPESHTDFVFAVLGQELGFVGVVIIISAFAILVGRGLSLATKLPCRFPMFLVFGLSAWLGMQAAINMAVVTSLVPTKGLTLPLVSYGRSSLVVTLVAIGILLRASAEARSQLLRLPGGSVGRKKRRTNRRREALA